MRRISAGAHHSPPFAFGTQSCLTHQSGNAFARAVPALIPQFHAHTWTSLSAMMRDKDLLNCFCELSIFSFALAYRALSPGVIATFRDAKHLTQDCDGKFLLVFFDKPVFHR